MSRGIQVFARGHTRSQTCIPEGFTAIPHHEAAANWTPLLVKGWGMWCVSHRTVNEWHWKDIESQNCLWINIPSPDLNSWRSQHSRVGSTEKPAVPAWSLSANADSSMGSALDLSPTQRQQDHYLKITKIPTFPTKNQQLLHKVLWSIIQMLINTQFLLIYTHTHTSGQQDRLGFLSTMDRNCTKGKLHWRDMETCIKIKSALCHCPLWICTSNSWNFWCGILLPGLSLALFLMDYKRSCWPFFS